ncbi:hypothetical protein LTR78_007594 [Recurvomyces mirabilis]|uniref:Uncharacterized protein n=1 Tax=Recurvomyces mirabilis TaxID=574656 RepID=A0AAE0WHC7_9PEZI|nr:hypothetical protein LTR78_007594 [Recurvomyces mirabilis]KAK5159894.1 hypothetical protein LTS14_002000 [Recurvomyces mirabilis]
MSLICPLRLLGTHIQAAKNTASYFEGLIPSLAVRRIKSKITRDDSSASAGKAASKSPIADAAVIKNSTAQVPHSSPNKISPKPSMSKNLTNYARTVGVAHADGVSLGPDVKVRGSVDMRVISMAYVDGVTLVPDFEVVARRGPIDQDI